MTTTSGHPPEPPRLGLRENLGQFSLLLLVNAFVGAMVGMERSILPILAEREFGLASSTAIVSFVLGFGLAKAFANLVAGGLADRWGRRNTLLAGWIVGLPVPLMILLAPSWEWVVAANLLLGVNQGLCWSAAIIMKVDLVGPRRRGFAIGLNETSGYLAVSIAALATGWWAQTHGLRQPFLIGIVVPLAGLACSLLARETGGHARVESRDHAAPQDRMPTFGQVLARGSWSHRSLFATSQAGMVNNLNDGVSWGLFPLLFVARGASLPQTAVLVAIYPAVWAVGQLATGPLSDRWGRKWMIALGMAVQGAALIAIGLGDTLVVWAAGSVLLGTGTALVYPTLLGAVSDHAHPSWRASAIGVYRLWRDFGYALGAVVAGAVADRAGIPAAIQVAGFLTVVSGAFFVLRYEERGSPVAAQTGVSARVAPRPTWE